MASHKLTHALYLYLAIVVAVSFRWFQFDVLTTYGETLINDTEFFLPSLVIGMSSMHPVAQVKHERVLIFKVV